MSNFLKTLIYLAVAVPGFCLQAENNGMIDGASPKLKSFFSTHPVALNSLTNNLPRIFNAQSFRLYYFYTDDDSVPRSYHYYPEDLALCIVVRENQHVTDEFLCLLFETVNSQYEEQFTSLFRKAKAGTVEREEFAVNILQVEFDALKQTRNLLTKLQFTETEIAESHYYRRFRDCPNDFNDFLVYKNKIGGKRDVLKEYQLKYDSLRKK